LQNFNLYHKSTLKKISENRQGLDKKAEIRRETGTKKKESGRKEELQLPSIKRYSFSDSKHKRGL